MVFQDSTGQSHAFRRTVPLSLNDFRIATAGDVGDTTTGNGGLFSSVTAPTLSGTASTFSQRLTWIASSSIAIAAQINLPEDFDGRDDVLVDLWVAGGGTTNPATFTVTTNWNSAAADVTDTATDAVPSTTIHQITARISAADIPDGARYFSIALTPAAHTTDTMLLDNVAVSYVAKNV
jgi:hypothetical protein